MQPKHYNNSNYDRGHIIPAADFSEEDRNRTFTMANISPQVKNDEIGLRRSFQRFHRDFTYVCDITDSFIK